MRGICHTIISETTGYHDSDDIWKIEDCMREDIFHSTLDWQSRAEFIRGAEEAVALLKECNEL